LRSVFRPCPILILGILALGGCAATAPNPEAVLFRSDHWPEVVEAGFVVAPVAGVNVLNEVAEPTAFFTGEFFAALQQSLPGTPLVSPDEVFSILSGAGENAHARLRSLQRRLVREEKLDPVELATISRELQHRYLLMAWMDEGVAEGIHRTDLDDYRAFDDSMEVHRFPTEELHGHITAVLLDLQTNELILRGEVDYESVGLEDSDGGIQSEAMRARASAAIRLADLMTRL
jgi:hypothetical protein